MTTDAILISRDDAVATVTLNRPEKRNALNLPMWLGLTARFAEIASDDSIRAVVLTGAGDHFGVGADISEFETVYKTAADAEDYGAIMFETVCAIRDCPKPVESSMFGAPVSKLGVTMPLMFMEVLVQVTGPVVAKEILLEARVFDAAEARLNHLVTRIVPDSDVREAAMKSAVSISRNSPLSNVRHKALVNRLASGEVMTAADHTGTYACFDSADFREGYRAFLEKRKPVFTGC